MLKSVLFAAEAANRAQTLRWHQKVTTSECFCLMHEIKSCIDLSERHGVGDHFVIWILPSIYQSTIIGTSVRPLAPPKAVPRHERPSPAGRAW
ncbi:MAG: hypothetical protein CM15mP103_12820 [Gammaproteobacteria bacterium]|nr:MAG: hypothetical protein CM15mP103_12820 [Gammaproteobacteria bacterium]